MCFLCFQHFSVISEERHCPARLTYHLLLLLSNSTFCALCWSLVRCPENGHICPEPHLASPFKKNCNQALISARYSLAKDLHTDRKRNNLLKQCLFNNKLYNKTFNYLIKLLPLKLLFVSCCLAGLISNDNAGESEPRALQAEVPLRGADPPHPDRAAAPPAHRPLSAAAIPALLQAFSSLLFPLSLSFSKATERRGATAAEAEC